MKLKTKVHLKLRYKSTLKLLKRRKGKKIIILGTPIHGNIGDLAIAENETLFLQQFGANVIDIPTDLLDIVFESDLIQKQDMICLHGGGNMGIDYFFEEEIRQKAIQRYKENKIIIFPQTIDYGKEEKGIAELTRSSEIYSKHKNLCIFAREIYSYNILKKVYSNNKVGLVPDIVLSHDFFDFKSQRNGVLICMRNDIEKTIDDGFISQIKTELKRLNMHYDVTDTSSPAYVDFRIRHLQVEAKLKQFSEYKLVITDRLHGMIFAYLTKTPCIVYSNSNFKIKGVYEKWLSSIPYLKFESQYSINCFLSDFNELISIEIGAEENMLKNDFVALKQEVLEWMD